MNNPDLQTTAGKARNGTDYGLLRIKTRVSITKPPEASTICMEVIQDGVHYIIGTLGGLSLIQGAKKARKTYYVSAYIATLLSGRSIIHHRGCLPYNKGKVLFFDTEQGSRSVRKVQTRIHAMAGLDMDRESDKFQYYSLRGIPMKERSELINYCLENTQEVGAVIIDGARDLIQSFNDDGESYSIIDKLMTWSDKYQIHIAVVVHENPGTDKARGHLGTELGNKAESIIRLKKVDSAFSEVESENREKDFPSFHFTIDENDFPLVAEVEESSGRKDPKELARIIHINLLTEIFDEREEGFSFSKTTLIPVLKEKFKKYEYNFGDQKLKELITFYLDQELLENRSLTQAWRLVMHKTITEPVQTSI